MGLCLYIYMDGFTMSYFSFYFVKEMKVFAKGVF